MSKETPFCRHMTLLNKEQLERVATRQLEFLKLIHPHLAEEGWSDGAVEIRPIKRDGDDKTYVSSYNTFGSTEKDKDYLVKFLEKINGRGFCLYFSLFAFDNKMVCYKEDGKKYTKGKINNQNALFTTSLMADFDDITYDEFMLELERFAQIELNPIVVFTGHGYQIHILLDRRVYNKNILKKYTELLVSRGFKVDDSITDAARQSRLVEWRNCKELDTKYPGYNPIDPELPATMQLATDFEIKRYSVVDVFKRIQGLPVVIPQTEDEIITETELEAIETQPLVEDELKIEENKTTDKVSQVEIYSYSQVFHMIDFENLPTPLQKMLIGTPQGCRNDAMLFLIPFLKNSAGLTFDEIVECMTAWGEHCQPRLKRSLVEKEVARLYAYKYDGLWGKYSSKLAKTFGAFDFVELKNDDKIKIPNQVIEALAEKPFNEGVLRTYLLILLAFHEDDTLQNLTNKEIAVLTDNSLVTIKRHISELYARKFLNRRTQGVNRKNEECFTNYPNPILFINTQGFKAINASTIELMYDKLSDGEAMLYLYMKSLTLKQKGKVVLTSQSKLGEAVTRTQHGVSQMTDELQAKGFLNKKTEGESFFKRTKYVLKK